MYKQVYYHGFQLLIFSALL